jgi:hypothetical protein
MKRTLLSLTLCLVAVPLFAAAPEPMIVAQYGALQWHPKEALPPGAFSSAVRGDPGKGAYDFIAKFPAHYTVPEHSHTNEVWVVMLKGAMTISRQGAPDVTIAESGFFSLPAKMHYVAHCEAECSFLVHGDLPFDLIYANEKDDPRKRK